MELYGLIGHPLGHSQSPRLFAEIFRSEGVEGEYRLFDLENIDMLPGLVSANPELAGFNVTIPYKISVRDYLDRVTPEAERVGSVNAVRVERQPDGGVLLYGHNTDCVGFRRSVSPMLEGVAREKGKPALVLGTGGASLAAVVALQDLGFEVFRISREEGKGDLDYRSLTPQLVWDTPLVVNSTPAGMWPDVNSAPPFPFEYLRGEGQVAFDMVYNPEETLFLRIASAHGLRTAGGMEMLRNQAAAAWDFFRTR